MDFLRLGCGGRSLFFCVLNLLSASRLAMDSGEAFFRFGEVSGRRSLVSVSSCGVCESVWAMARNFFDLCA